MHKPSAVASFFALGITLSFGGVVGCAPIKPIPGTTTSGVSNDFEVIEQELRNYSSQIINGGPSTFYKEVYSFTERDRDMRRDEDRDRYFNELSRKENSADYFVAVRELYKLGKSDRRIASDANRMSFAERYADFKDPIEAAAIYIDAYKFFLEERKAGRDMEADRFCTHVFDSKNPRVFWKNYRAFYLVAKNDRRMNRDIDCDSFAQRLAEKAVDLGGQIEDSRGAMLTPENWKKGFLVSEQFLGGISDLAPDAKGYLGYVLNYQSGETVFAQEFSEIEAAVASLNAFQHAWVFESVKQCGGGTCGGGKCGSGDCGSGCGESCDSGEQN